MKKQVLNDKEKNHKPIPPSIPQEICGACKEPLFVPHPLQSGAAIFQLRNCACFRFVEPLRFTFDARLCCKHDWTMIEGTEHCLNCPATCIRDKGGHIVEYSANVGEYSE